MEKEIFATIDGKDYGKHEFQLYVGKLVNRNFVTRLHKKGYSNEQIADIIGVKESYVDKIVEEINKE